MSKLPPISGRKMVKIFQKLGYETVRMKGSHIRMHHPKDKEKKPLTIPDHKTLGRCLLRKLIRDAGITLEEFHELL